MPSLLRGVSLTFFLGWPQSIILLISASQADEISDVSQYTWPLTNALMSIFFFSCWNWSLNSGLQACKAGPLLLELGLLVFLF
jgi:hypothetical protein